MALDRDPADACDVDGATVDVRRNHAGPSVQPMAGDEARHGHLTERLAQVRDHRKHPYIDLAGDDVTAAALVDRDARIRRDAGRNRRLRRLEALDERIQADGTV